MEYKRVHFIGIGGIGVSALAKLLKARGVYVSGSDVTDSAIVQSCRDVGVQVWLGSRPERIGKDVELIVYSGAVPEDDEERIRGRHIDAREVVYNEFLGEVSRDSFLVAVSGTHGKSTTTAMLGYVLIDAKKDPTVVVGSQVPGLKQGNLQVGKSDMFVAEACEYESHMCLLHPNVAVVTNVEFDHPDYYKDVDHVRREMKRFVDLVPSGGMIVWNADDIESLKLMNDVQKERCDRPGECDIKIISFGSDGDVTATIDRKPGIQVMNVFNGGVELGQIQLHLPGAYNIQNALAVIATALNLDVSFESIANSLEKFTGLWRRFEKLGKFNGADVYSDYAHHPTALKNLLKGTREFLPDRDVVLCFQPHQHARTRGLFNEFVESMDDADKVVLVEVYDVAGRNETDSDVSSVELVEAIKKRDVDRGVDREVVFAADLDSAKRELERMVKENNILLMTGAGEIDNLARKLV